MRRPRRGGPGDVLTPRKSIKKYMLLNLGRGFGEDRVQCYMDYNFTSQGNYGAGRATASLGFFGR